MALVKYNNRSILNVTALESIASGSMNLITTNTISSAVSSSSFTSGIDSTYDTYLFKFINIHPATDEAHFTFQTSTDGGSNYNTTLTSTYILIYHAENDSETSIGYQASHDQAQTTNFQNILHGTGNANDESGSGELFLFSPSSTTFVKHFLQRASTLNASGDGYNYQNFAAGYFNTTSAINAVQFKMSSGNIDSGTIKMYGLSKS